ncbi:MAG TPA: RDD family protein [Longimicrobiaceae bacterium]|nr:RDD family protein [Longimicrobiaceae bacterium]
MTEATPAVDPRTIVTHDAFRVAPELLGRPLASPWRRLGAMALDGILLALLSSTATVFFGLAAAYVLFRISRSSGSTGYIKRSIRLLFRFLAAAVLFVVVLSVGDWIADLGEPDEVPSAITAPGMVTLDGLEGLVTAAELLALRQADNQEEAMEVATQVAERLGEAGVPATGVKEILDEVAQSTNHDWVTLAVDSVTGGLAVTAISDTAEMAVPDTVVELTREIARLESSNAQLTLALADAEAEAEGGGILDWLGTLANDLGLGLGWSGLYFTAFLTLGRGRTPGKHLMRIRVIRLDTKPIGWWASFERFGGYAASIATGLLGFAQIFWDRNRQGIHDKIAETVVIDG